MLVHLKEAFRSGYPKQFWVLFFGTIIIRTGSSMIWPFTINYVSDKLDVAMAMAAVLLTIRSLSSVVSSFVAGPIADSVGRKTVMILGILGYIFTYLGMVAVNSMAGFVLVMVFGGLVEPLFRVGVDAILVDLIPEEKRIDAYSVNRMAQNIGVAMGPGIGGALMATSYDLALFLAASAMSIFLLLLLVGVRETIAEKVPLAESLNRTALFSGYQRVFRDQRFMQSTLLIITATMGFSMVWTLSATYTRDVLGISEAYYGWLPATNALMVITLQLLFTQFTKRFSLLRAMAIGCAVYVVSIASFSVAQNFWWIWGAFVVLTCGEMFYVPSTTTFAANLAPQNMRGRYMSLFSLHWPIASGLGPLVGGLINDNVGPRWIWIGAALFPLLASFGYARMDRKEKNRAALESEFA